jgi:hypothetical protein
MKLDDARNELNAARFFFDLLREEQEKCQRETSQPPDNFRFLLKPFLNTMYTLQNRVMVQVTPTLRRQARIARKSAKGYFKGLCEKWVATLSPEDQTLWRSMEELRHSEVHKKRTETVRRDKDVPAGPVGDSTGVSERSWAFAAQYIDVSQGQGPAYYVPARRQSFPFSRLEQVTVKVHHFTDPEQREVVEACRFTVALLERFIDHFERIVP